MSRNITIAGLGWLGIPLATALLKKGFAVKGSVTTQSKADEITHKGIPAFPLILAENGISGAIDSLLTHCDILIIMIPPGLRKNTGANYALKMARFLQAIEQNRVKKVILISSISVYDDAQGNVTEIDTPKPQTLAGKQLYDVEQLFFNSPHFECSVVRFGGLYGGARNPVKFLAGRKNLNNGNAPVNLIHRDDCIGILLAIIEQNAFRYIFNGVSPEHPIKQLYYEQQARRLQLEVPTYSTSEDEVIYKQVDSMNLKEILGYKFIHKLM